MVGGLVLLLAFARALDPSLSTASIEPQRAMDPSAVFRTAGAETLTGTLRVGERTIHVYAGAAGTTFTVYDADGSLLGEGLKAEELPELLPDMNPADLQLTDAPTESNTSALLP